MLSRRQLLTVASIRTAKLDIHCGPYGCGKSYAVDMGLGLACASSKPPTDGSVIALVGKTAQSVKTNIGNSLSAKFGDNFRYDTGKKDGKAKDAVLYGHLIRIIGLNDSNAEERLRGLNAYKIIGDEVSTWGKDNFDKVFGRLRGEKPNGWDYGFIGTTNPDSPSHWLWEKVNEPETDINYVKWTEHDNITPTAKEYYDNLKKRYRHSPAYYKRYVLGEWASAEGVVYTEFNDKNHLFPKENLTKDAMEKTFVSYKVGIDFGTTNPTAIIVVGVTSDNDYVVVEEYYKRDQSLTSVINAVRDVIVRYGVRLRYLYIDPASKVLKKGLQEVGIDNVIGGDNSVMNGINHVKDLFANDRLYISDGCTNLINELYTYAYSDKDGVNVVKSDDHACDALRYALYT